MKIEWDDSESRQTIQLRPRKASVEAADQLAEQASREAGRKVSRTELLEAVIDQALSDPKFTLKLPKG